MDPYINVMFPPRTIPEGQDPAVSVVIFEWKDEDLIGIREKPDSPQVLPHFNVPLTRRHLTNFHRKSASAKTSG